MKVSLRDVTQRLGNLPQMTRLAAPVAHVVASALESSLPELTPAAARVLAQHLWFNVQNGASIGTADAILKIAERFGITPRKLNAAPALVDVARANEPLSVFIAIARKVSAARRREIKRGGAVSVEDVRILQQMIAEAAKSPSGAGLSDLFQSALKSLSGVARGAVGVASQIASSDLARNIGRDVALSTLEHGIRSVAPASAAATSVLQAAASPEAFDVSGAIRPVRKSDYALPPAAPLTDYNEAYAEMLREAEKKYAAETEAKIRDLQPRAYEPIVLPEDVATPSPIELPEWYGQSYEDMVRQSAEEEEWEYEQPSTYSHRFTHVPLPTPRSVSARAERDYAQGDMRRERRHVSDARRERREAEADLGRRSIYSAFR